MDEEFIKKIGDMLMQINETLKMGVPSLEARVDHVIKYKVTDYNQLDRLFSDLMDYTQIDEGLAVFKKLGRYSFYIHPELTAFYVNFYREHFDPNTPYSDDDEQLEDKSND